VPPRPLRLHSPHVPHLSRDNATYWLQPGRRRRDRAGRRAAWGDEGEDEHDRSAHRVRDLYHDRLRPQRLPGNVVCDSVPRPGPLGWSEAKEHRTTGTESVVRTSRGEPDVRGIRSRPDYLARPTRASAVPPRARGNKTRSRYSATDKRGCRERRREAGRDAGRVARPRTWSAAQGPAVDTEHADRPAATATRLPAYPGINRHDIATYPDTRQAHTHRR
jgi:hypothetical protein